MAIYYKNLSSDYPIPGTFKRANGDYLVVTEASRPVDDDGWTIIEASADTRVIYVSSSEGDDAAGVPQLASDIGVTTPDDDPTGDLVKRATPIMTSHTQPSGEVSASSEDLKWGEYYGYKAFNRGTSSDDDDVWQTDESSSGDEWLQYKFDSSVTIIRYVLIPDSRTDRMARDWILQGSNDGTNWTDLDTVTGETGWELNERRYFDIDAPAEYEYYRLYITANNGGSGIRMSGLELLESTSEIAPVASVGLAYQLVRDGHADWILFKRGDEWGTSESRLKPRSGRSLEESFVLGAYGSSSSRPKITGDDNQDLFNRSNVVIMGLDVFTVGGYSGGANVLMEDCNFYNDDASYIIWQYYLVDFELRRSIVSQPQVHGLEIGTYWNGCDGLLFEEMLFNLHIDQTLSEEDNQAKRNMFYLQDNNTNIALYRNIVTNSVRNSIMNRGSGRAVYRENILARNPYNIAAVGYDRPMHTQSPLHADGNVIIADSEGSVRGIDVGGLESGTLDTIDNNIVVGHFSQHSIGVRESSYAETEEEQPPIENFQISNNIVHDSSSPLSIASRAENYEVFDNLLNDDTVTFVDPDRTLGTYQEHVSGETYVNSTGQVDVNKIYDEQAYWGPETPRGGYLDLQWGVQFQLSGTDDVTFNTATVEAEGAGDVTFQLWKFDSATQGPDAGTLVAETTLSVVAGQQSITLDFTTTGAGDYWLGLTNATTALMRTEAGEPYPWVSMGFDSIEAVTAKNFAGTSTNTRWYFLFNLEILDTAATPAVISSGLYNRTEAVWVSGDKFDLAWGVTEDIYIEIDGSTYMIDSVTNNETLILLEDSPYGVPDAGLTNVAYTYEADGFRNFIFNAKQQSRQNWNLDYHPVKILDYFNAGFSVVGEDPKDFEPAYNIGPAERDHTEGVIGAIGV